MTSQQFIEEIKRLPVTERVALIEAISRSVQEDLQRGGGVSPVVESKESTASDSGSDRVPLSQRLRGTVKFDGGPPTDEEVKEMIADYLTEKYS
jgi:hypothetical protein